MFHVLIVMAFNASWEMMAGLLSWIGVSSAVSLDCVGMIVSMYCLNACVVVSVVSPSSCSSSGTTGKTFVVFSLGDIRRLALLCTVRFIFCCGSLYQFVVNSFVFSPSVPSVVPACSPSVVSGMTRGAFRITAGVVGVLNVF